MKQQIDSSMAEKWLTPDTFVYRGKIYRINPNGKIQEIKNGRDKMEFQPRTLENGEQPIGGEEGYIALFGGVLHEVVGVAPDGHLDTAYGNSAQDAINQAISANLQPY